MINNIAPPTQLQQPVPVSSETAKPANFMVPVFQSNFSQPLLEQPPPPSPLPPSAKVSASVNLCSTILMCGGLLKFHKIDLVWKQ